MGDGTRVSEVGLWFGALGGFTAWAAHLGVSYALVPYVCGTGREWALHLATAALAAVAATATGVAWRARSRLGEDGGGAGDGEEAGRKLGRQRFLAVGGILLSGFFLGLILVEGLPALIMDACESVPTLSPFLVLAGSLLAPPAIGGVPDALRGVVFPVVAHAAEGLGADLGTGTPGTLGPIQVAARGETRPAWLVWNWDPWILAGLAAAAALYGRGLRRLWGRAGPGRGVPRLRAACYLAGLTSIFVALVSPVDAVSEELFWVHMIQHVLLMVVAPPLLVLGRPALAVLWALPREARRWTADRWRGWPALRSAWRVLTHPLVVLVLHVAALWAWHLPPLYEAALADDAVHHLQHASFFFTALLFWWVVVHVGRGRLPGYGAAIAYVFATLLQGGLLGALLTLAPRPWYESQSAGASAWGMDALADQQLAGTLMWVPTGIVYAAAALLLFAAWLREAERRTARRESFFPEPRLSSPLGRGGSE